MVSQQSSKALRPFFFLKKVGFGVFCFVFIFLPSVIGHRVKNDDRKVVHLRVNGMRLGQPERSVVWKF